MANLGQLVVNLEANIARFTSDMGRASQTVEQTMGRMNAAADVVRNVLGAVGVALSVDVLVGEANKAISALADLDDMAQKTGSSVETLSKLSKVAAFTGTDLGAVDGILVKLSKNLASTDEEGSKAAKALAAIGISTDELKGKDPAQAFVIITRRLQEYEDGGNKVAVVTDLMSKSAADLLPFMNDVAESIDKFAGDSAEAAAAAAAYQDQLGLLKLKYDEMTTSIVTAALPAANDFIGALSGLTTESNNLTGTTSVDTWADDVAIGLARMVDVAMLIPRVFGAVKGSFQAVIADIQLMGVVAENANPINAAKNLLKGINPNDVIKAALAERNAVVDESNRKLAELWNAPANRMEQAVIGRIACRFDAQLAAGADALAGIVPAQDPGRTKLAYGGGNAKPVPGEGGQGATPAAADLAPAIARMREWAPDQAIGARIVDQANDETLALRNAIDATLDLEDATQRRLDQQLRAADQASQNAENIRLSLMTEAESEQAFHDTRIEQLRIFGESKLGNEIAANALIEQETARHERAKLDIQRANQLQMLGMSGDAADQLYNLMQKAGLEQTALAKAVFLASKAIAVAEIIMNTEVAASKAQAQFGAFGTPIAMAIRVAGYASAGMTAGLAIAEASAEGGYDIPAGANPVTQLHEKEMVLPKAQAEVIRNLATRGGAGGFGGQLTQTIHINIDGKTDMAENRRLIAAGVAQGNAELVDKLQRAGKI